MNDQPHSASDELLRLQQVETISGLKRSQLYALIGKGEFPKPAKLGAASRWSLREIQDWIADKLSKRDAARTADTCNA